MSQAAKQTCRAREPQGSRKGLQGLSQGVAMSALTMDRNQGRQPIPLEVNSPSKQSSCRTHLEVWNS